jgi:hypothetical protein
MNAANVQGATGACCGDPWNCPNRECGILGESAEQARSSAVVFATKRDADMFVERRIKPHELRLPELSAPPVAESALRRELITIAMCSAVGVALGLLLVAIVLFVRGTEIGQ